VDGYEDRRASAIEEPDRYGKSIQYDERNGGVIMIGFNFLMWWVLIPLLGTVVVYLLVHHKRKEKGA